jgi:hypothetical protein
MKRLFTLVITLLVGGCLAFAQTGGGAPGKTADTTQSTSGKKGHKGGKKGHKGGKKSKKGSSTPTTPPPK